ncbi:MAG TPA: response regulator transcription factor [Candidatus Angelobacter sp.]
MIRVCIVEDQTLVRHGFRSLLELTEDMKVVAEAGDGEEALQLILKTKPDVVLLDVQLPKRNGIEVLRMLKESNQLPPTLILTTFDDDNLLLEAIRAGARGFLLKDVTLKQLTDAIRTLKAGGTLIKPVVTERILRGLQQAKPEFSSLNPPDPLTERETEVLRLMVAGYSNHEIADAVGTSEGTVKNHVSSILSKLGVRDRTRAVLKALELGFI